jgi:putative ABC transport system permease protein
MFKNNLILAWRQMQKKPALSLFKILGLGIGIGVSLLLIKYISWHWNFDRSLPNGDQIVRVKHKHYSEGDLTSQSAMTYSGISVIAKDRFPKVIDYTRLGRWIANDVVFRYKENMYRGKDCFFADPSIFDFFSLELIIGDSETALVKPNSLVITESIAKNLFGQEDPIGKEVLFENFKTFIITGVVKDPPRQSHLQFDILGSLSTMNDWGFEVYKDNQLNAAYVYAYLQLDKTADSNELTTSLNKEISKLKSSPESITESFELQPLQEIHLYSDLDNEIAETGQGKNFWILGSVALLILILGWVNHFNLFTAGALDQYKSLSIRKIIGADRKHLFYQLLVASTLTSICGLGVGLIKSPFKILHCSI